MRRLSVDAECKGTYTCPAVWRDDDPDFLIIVGHPVDIGAAPDTAVRLKRQIVTDSGFDIVDSACRADVSPDRLVVLGEPVRAEAVLLPNGTSGVAADEVAVRVQHQAARVAKVR